MLLVSAPIQEVVTPALKQDVDEVRLIGQFCKEAIKRGRMLQRLGVRQPLRKKGVMRVHLNDVTSEGCQITNLKSGAAGFR